MNILPINQGVSLQSTSKNILSDESADILQRLKRINAGHYFFKADHILVNKLKSIEPIELRKVLKRFCMDIVQEGAMSDPVKFLDRLTTVIPFAKIQEAVKEDVKDVLKEAQEMFEEAKYYLQMTNENYSPGIRARLLSILEGFVSVIESIITAFGIGDFSKPAESELQAIHKSRKIMILLSLFTAVSSIMVPVLGAANGALVIGGIILGIAILSALWPFVKPKTTQLPGNAENWTKMVRGGGMVANGRKETLDQIADIIRMNRHAILVGPSRVGKSLTAKAFALAIERGDYPELKGKVVFRINTTDLISQKEVSSQASNILNKISLAMGRHRDDIILVLDEIHMACKNSEKIADQLKTYLDENGEFPHVIGITTVEEYEAHVKNNHAFSLRFDRVNIENTSQDETLRILGDTVLLNPSKPIIEAEMLDHVYKESCKIKEASQPATSLKLLKQCINRTENTQRSHTEKKIVEVSNKAQAIRSKAAASRGRKKEVTNQIADLEKQLKELQETLHQEKKGLDKLFKVKALLARVTKETYSSVLRISANAQKVLNPQNEKELKLFVLLQEFLGKSLETYIKETAESLGVNAVIDEKLVNEVASHLPR